MTSGGVLDKAVPDSGAFLPCSLSITVEGVDQVFALADQGLHVALAHVTESANLFRQAE